MATQQDYQEQKERLADLEAREMQARLKSYDMHGGAHPGPNEKPMPVIITQFGTWAVTPFGVECLVYPYEIQWDSITDPVTDDDYWLKHLANKEWVVLADFADALRHGRKIHRYLQNLGTNNILPEVADLT
jgi:hypothetical protein